MRMRYINLHFTYFTYLHILNSNYVKCSRVHKVIMDHHSVSCVTKGALKT